ncbi:MAG: flagellar M-ring protein FliF [Alphaproteobacteria bacterium 33-17]|nr:MAG: flagellar M-ring protein FliF [Alphaproteobacteria bacterium 33-17]
MESLFQLFRSMSPGKIMAVTVGGLLSLVGIGYLIIAYSVKNFDVLYSSLDLADSYEIIKELENRNIEYKVKGNGSQVLVDEDKVLRLRMELAELGLPNKGSVIGYEIFDKADAIGTSSFLQNVNLVRALEGELSRTIGAIAKIESARVHLVVPKRELFSREVQKPSASVMIKTRGTDPIGKEQISAISHLVSTAVPGLETNMITIVDAKGRSLKLAADDDEDSQAAIVSNAEDFRINFEKRLKKQIEELLERSVGQGHVTAQVTADINFDRVVTNSEIYDPDGQVVRSLQSITESDSSTEGGQANVSVANNLPNTQQSTNGVAGQSQSQKVDQTTNYEISKTVRNHISETGTIKKLSIAIAVDGQYNVDDIKGTVSYLARTQEELQNFENLVKSAVGFDDKRGDKIEVVNFQFTQNLNELKPQTMKDWLKQEFSNLVQTFIIAAVVILVILLVIRPIALRAFELAKTDIDDTANIQKLLDEQAPNLAEGHEDKDVIDIQEAEIFARNNTAKSINDMVGKYPRETLTIMRKWLEENK